MFTLVRLQPAVCLAILLAAAVSVPVHAQDPSLDAALTYLKTYTFGAERTPLDPIDVAVREAGTDPAKQAALEQRFLAVLSGEAGLEGKRVLCTHLVYMGSAASVPVLKGLASVEGLQDYALRALVGIPGAESDAALIELAQGSTGALQHGAILALGRKQGENTAAALVQFAETGQGDVAQTAKVALGTVTNATSTAAFQRWLAAAGEKDPAVYAGALSVALSSLKGGDTATATALYTALFATGTPGHVRAAALQGLVALQPEAAVDLVIQAMADTDRELNKVAAGFIREIPGADATTKFAGLLATAPAPAQALLIKALQDRADPAASAAIAPLTQTGEESVRLAAIEALGKLGDASHVDLLLGLITTEKREMRATAEASLVTLPGATVNASLLNSAKTGAEPIQRASIEALAERNAKETVGDLLVLAASDSAVLAEESLRALRVLAEGKDVPALLALLDTAKTDSARGLVERAVGAAAERIEPAETRAVPVLAAYAQATAPASKEAMIRVLGQLGTDDALAALTSASASTERNIQIAAVTALAGWPNEAPLDQIREWADQKTDVEIHGIAFTGYVRMLRAAKSYSPDALLVHYKHALEIAVDDNERRAALSGVSDLSTLGALETAQGYTEGALQAEATQAVIKIASAISGAYPDKARTLLEGIAAATQDDAIKAQTGAALGVLNGFQDFITAWEVSGPYMMEGKTGQLLFSESFAPETAPESAEWSVMGMGVDKERPWLVDLEKTLGGVERVAYLRTHIHADAETDALLEMGTNDGVRAWLNGVVVHEVNLGRPLNPAEDQVKIHLNAGWNTLLIAVYQHGGEWQACAKLRGADGGALTGVKTAIDES
ncbi:MAG: HEAT repeat domain-containing protein [Candidatus Hydrogenedentes bacterium]|nr:HEAT repeat domain-containing protein [Candidatus Hydrogenedentota bacterium]